MPLDSASFYGGYYLALSEVALIGISFIVGWMMAKRYSIIINQKEVQNQNARRNKRKSISRLER